jgi:hypothetical protein
LMISSTERKKKIKYMLIAKKKNLVTFPLFTGIL